MNRVQARRSLRYARMAYRSPEILEPQLAAYGETLLNVFDISHTSTQGYLARRSEDGALIVSFRGTDPFDPLDRKTDFDWAWCEHPDTGGRVHRGFWQAFVSVSDDLAAALEPYYFSQPRLEFACHSLGAAIGVFAAYRSKRLGFTVDAVDLFGCPRVGNIDFRDAYNRDLKKQTVRYENCCDMVTLMPPAYFGWRHVGNAIYFDKDRLDITDPPWWYRVGDHIQARLEHLGRFGTRGVMDHLLVSYETALE